MTTSSLLPKTVVLKGSPVINERVSATSAAIQPGHLIEVTSAGTVRKEQTAPNGPRARLFAIEAGMIGGDIDDTYASGDTVVYGAFNSGDQVYAFLGLNENVSIGTYLQSDGAGNLEAVDSDGHAIAIALEAKVTTGAAARIRVEVL